MKSESRSIKLLAFLTSSISFSVAYLRQRGNYLCMRRENDHIFNFEECCLIGEAGTGDAACWTQGRSYNLCCMSAPGSVYMYENELTYAFNSELLDYMVSEGVATYDSWFDDMDTQADLDIVG